MFVFFFFNFKVVSSNLASIVVSYSFGLFVSETISKGPSKTKPKNYSFIVLFVYWIFSCIRELDINVKSVGHPSGMRHTGYYLRVINFGQKFESGHDQNSIKLKTYVDYIYIM